MQYSGGMQRQANIQELLQRKSLRAEAMENP